MGAFTAPLRSLEQGSRKPSRVPDAIVPTRGVRLTAFDLVRRTLSYLPPYMRLGVALVIVTLLLTLFGLLAPWPLTIIVDSVLGDHPLAFPLTPLLAPVAENKVVLLVVFAAAELGIKLASNGFQVLATYIHSRLDLGIGLDFRSDVFWHAEHLSVGYHERQRSGMMVYIINFLTTAAPTLLLSLMPMIQSALTLIGMLWISFEIDAELALLSLIIVPFIFYSVGYYATHIERQVQMVRELEGESLSIMHEALSMLKVVMAFGREDYEHRRFEVQGQQAVDERVRLTVKQTLFSLVVNSITVIGTAIVLGFGAFHVLEGRITAGQLLVVLSYIASVYSPLEAISGTLGSLQEQFTNLRMSYALLDAEPEIADGPGAREMERAHGAVRFEGVSFAYPGRQGTLQEVSFEAQPGQVIAVVGPTGAGKTTLLSLLPRFYDPSQGRIFLDGSELQALTLRSLRSQIAVVLQEPLLFSGTLRDNIRYGRLEATEEEIVAAAQAANAHEFIQRLPQGYDTAVGEKGARLSGGERQRICIARAFVKDAPILILDEPTTSIDSKTESVILDALERLMEGRTTFITAHRLSTIRYADLILVLNRGELVEQGRHDELLQQDGLYQQLYLLQQQIRSRRGPDGGRRTPLEGIGASGPQGKQDHGNGYQTRARGQASS